MSRKKNGLSQDRYDLLVVAVGTLILIALFVGFCKVSMDLFGPRTDDGTPVVIEEAP